MLCGNICPLLPWPQVELRLGYRHYSINNGAYSYFLFLSCLSSPSLFIKHHNTFITYSLNSESMHIISITFKTFYQTYSIGCIKGAYQIKANIISYMLKTIWRKAWHWHLKKAKVLSYLLTSFLSFRIQHTSFSILSKHLWAMTFH